MGRFLLLKLKEAMTSVLPVSLIVIILNFTSLVALTGVELIVFCASTVALIIGIAIFNLGSDLAMTPMGAQIGIGLTKSGRLTMLIGVCFAMGVMVTVAEPDLSVLAEQVSQVIDPTTLIVTVGAGVGLFLVFAILKIVFRKTLSSMLLFSYMMLFALLTLMIINGNDDFIPLSFDSGGVTTGPITVPFIMALGIGIAATLGGKNVEENSFGLIAMCSIGPMLAVTILGISASGEITYTLADYSMETYFGKELITVIWDTAKEVAIALGLIVAFFAILQFTLLKLPRKKLIQIAIGIGMTFFGLVIFLIAVKIGYMPIGYKLGTGLAESSPVVMTVISFILGVVVVLAEPAVHVLNKQVEEITEGTVSKRSMMIALSLGVGLSIGLSVIRIICDFSILYYLIPGYFISLGLSFFVPGLYTAIAFDSGGVASGPLTSSFILPFAVGACYVLQGEANIMSDAFGIVAMVAMTPLITIQSLSFRSVMSKRVSEGRAIRRIIEADDEQIIDFM
ncbi:MAG: DUF1538 domain-containing protein [Clostridia bacterium]|nr:DUF1538 domain-containing protein [Clostridia bacterium]